MVISKGNEQSPYFKGGDHESNESIDMAWITGTLPKKKGSWSRKKASHLVKELSGFFHYAPLYTVRKSIKSIPRELNAESRGNIC